MGEIAPLRTAPFNCALETGLRALIMLMEAHPEAQDLQTLVQLDYIALHSADAGGPPSLHPPLPLRSGELTVRRGLLERGLLLMASRQLVARIPSAERGFVYVATEASSTFVQNFRSPYILEFRDAAVWAFSQFGKRSRTELSDLTASFFKLWSPEFESRSPASLGDA